MDFSFCQMEDAPLPASPEMRILAIDVGGTGLKAAVLDSEGNLLSDRVRVKTPSPCKPEVLLGTLLQLVESLAALNYNRISIGFPGVVRRGTILTAPKLGTEDLRGYALARELSTHLGHEARLINDADMQGLAVVKGHGIEMVITLGTGFGSALYSEGQLGPHLELSVAPFRKGETYNDQLGNDALKKIGPEKWNRRVRKAIGNMRTLTNFDRLYVGGGNAKEITFKLDDDVEIIDNTNGVKGGAWLWRQGVQPA